MEDFRTTKKTIRSQISGHLTSLATSEINAKTKQVENRLFDFANFLEANIVLLYVDCPGEVPSRQIVKRCFNYNKIVVLPAFNPNTFEMTLMKIDHFDNDLKPGPRGSLEPDPNRCNTVPIECIDIAIIPGIAFDEKGGRIGSGQGYYDRLMPRLTITTRKVALAFEDQIIPQIQMESHDRHVDIIITNNRIIYKI